MACYFDARDWVKWSKITLTLTCTGSYAYTKSGGTQNFSGSISGSSVLELDRIDFDPDTFPDLAQITAPAQFLTFRQRRGCPLFMNSTEIYFAGQGSVGTINISVTTPSGTATENEVADFGLQLAIGSTEAPGCDCGDPESQIIEASGFALVADNDEFAPFADVVDGITDLFADWLTGDTFSRTIDYDIISPASADIPLAVCGTGSTTIGIVFDV